MRVHHSGAACASPLRGTIGLVSAVTARKFDGQADSFDEIADSFESAGEGDRGRVAHCADRSSRRARRPGLSRARSSACAAVVFASSFVISDRASALRFLRGRARSSLARRASCVTGVEALDPRRDGREDRGPRDDGPLGVDAVHPRRCTARASACDGILRPPSAFVAREDGHALRGQYGCVRVRTPIRAVLRVVDVADAHRVVACRRSPYCHRRRSDA